MTFYSRLSQVFGYSGTIFNRPSGGTLWLRRLQPSLHDCLAALLNGPFSGLRHQLNMQPPPHCHNIFVTGDILLLKFKTVWQSNIIRLQL